MSFKEIFTYKLTALFSKLNGEIFTNLFTNTIPDLFFRDSKNAGEPILRKRVIYFVVRNNYGVHLNEEVVEEYRTIFELLTLEALLYDDTLLTNAVSELYFKDRGTAQLYLPNLDLTKSLEDQQRELVDFYANYYKAPITSQNFPIPLEPTCLPFLLLKTCAQGESTPLITPANSADPINENFSSKCKELIIKPLINYFWDGYGSYTMQSGIKDALKYKLIFQYRNATDEQIKELLTGYLYCYLFDTCKIAKNHNGIIMDNVPGEIIELNLVQYTQNGGRTYLSYSVAELQDMVDQFSNIEGGNSSKTIVEWKAWAAGLLPPNAVKLAGRPETSLELMNMFTGDVLQGVVSNYSYFSKKQKRELGIDDLVDANGNELVQGNQEVINKASAKPRTLMELFNIVLYKVALVNIENINVAMVSLLSEKMGSYLSNPEELYVDIMSGIDLDEPAVKFYNFFISLFLPPPPYALDRQGKLESTQVTKLNKILIEVFAKTKSDQEFKRDLRRIVYSNPNLIAIISDIIGSIVSKNKRGPGTNTYFYKQYESQVPINPSYLVFLQSLLPKGYTTSAVAPSAAAVKKGRGGSKTHKNLPKKKHSSFHRRRERL